MQSQLHDIRRPGCNCPCCFDGQSTAPFFHLESITGASLPTLANEIHPLFAQSKFQAFYSRLTNPSILTHALQLATNLIDATLPFWHSILLASIRPMDELEKIGNGEVQWEIFDEVEHHPSRPETLTKKQQEETRLRLVQLAEYVTIGECSSTMAIGPDHPGIEHFDSGAVTMAGQIIDGNKPFSQRSSFWTGRTSHIQLEAHLLKALQRNQQAKDLVPYCMAAFHFANDLCHELAHVACYARRPQVSGHCGGRGGRSVQRHPGNLFFTGSDVAEPGLEWESRTWGGLIGRVGARAPLMHADGQAVGPLYRIDGVATTMPGMIGVREWPCPNLVRDYRTYNGQIGVRKVNSLIHMEVWWSTYFQDMWRLFRQEFWDLDQHRVPRALWPRKLNSGLCPVAPLP